MPLPSPKPKEKEDDFISRCIKFLMDENPKMNQKQAIAIAYSQWRKSKNLHEGSGEAKPIEFSFESDFSFEEDAKKPLLIRGTALNAGLIQQKNLVIPKEELQGLADSLKRGMDGKGAYILPDHKKETTALLGRVSNAWVSKDGSKVEFEGTVSEESMAKKIRDGLVTYLSSGIFLDKQECSICGADYLSEGCNHRLGKTYDGVIANMVGRGIQGREVSTVLYPADLGAKINIALSDAISDIERQKEIMLNKGETQDNSNTIRGDKKVSLLELTEEQLAKHPFVAELMDKISKFTEAELGYKNEVSSLKDKIKSFEDAERARVEARRVELVNTLISKRKEAGLPEKKPEDYKSFDEKALAEMIETVGEVSQRSKGIVEFTENDGDRGTAKEALKKKLGW